MAPERRRASFAALVRASLLVCAISLVLTLIVWILFRRLEIAL